MYCKNCRQFIKKENVFCPNCGLYTGVKKDSLNENHHKVHHMHARNYIFIGISLFIVIFLGTRIRAIYIREPTLAAITDKTTISESEKEASLTGIWKSKQGEVTFTESGNMMLGKDGITLGGGWLQYEIVDDTTLSISGGDFPIGLNMKYNLDGESLSLEVKGSTMVFTKE